MELDNPSFYFGFDYAGETVMCKAVMRDDGYDIYFDERWVASISHTDEWTWIQASGVILPTETIKYIAQTIESKYR